MWKNVQPSNVKHTFGVGGTALIRFRSYLYQRPSFVKTGTAQFSKVVGDTGVSQGSSLGPLLFSLFITPLGGVISRFAVPYHQYAGDTQLYIAVDKATATSTSNPITACTTEIYEWLLHNCLALNQISQSLFSSARPPESDRSAMSSQLTSPENQSPSRTTSKSRTCH